jgi:hypothetical protein
MYVHTKRYILGFRCIPRGNARRTTRGVGSGVLGGGRCSRGVRGLKPGANEKKIRDNYRIKFVRMLWRRPDILGCVCVLYLRFVYYV